MEQFYLIRQEDKLSKYLHQRQNLLVNSTTKIVIELENEFMVKLTTFYTDSIRNLVVSNT